MAFDKIGILNNCTHFWYLFNSNAGLVKCCLRCRVVFVKKNCLLESNDFQHSLKISKSAFGKIFFQGNNSSKIFISYYQSIVKCCNNFFHKIDLMAFGLNRDQPPAAKLKFFHNFLPCQENGLWDRQQEMKLVY